MKCNIRYVGKMRNGIPKYYCTVHKAMASDKLGNKLKECLCNNKEAFNNLLNIKNKKINNIKLIYTDILNSTIPKIIIDNKEFKGILKYDNCLLSYKDLSGIMLAKLNKITLEKVKCSHCNQYHSDNGKFAYTPHRTHLCLYCGHLFRVKERNVGHELEMIYDIPEIKLEDKLIKIENECLVEYDLLKGKLMINHQNGNRLWLKDREILVVDFLNHILENEF